MKARKLNKEVWLTLRASIAAGEPPNIAALRAGISPSTFLRWLEAGRKGDPRWRNFTLGVDRAEAEYEAKTIALIMEAAQGYEVIKTTTKSDANGVYDTQMETSTVRDWRAAAFILERRWGQRWAALRRLQVAGALTLRQEVIVHDDGDGLDIGRLLEEGAGNGAEPAALAGADEAAGGEGEP